jgi:hypothetical protein
LALRLNLRLVLRFDLPLELRLELRFAGSVVNWFPHQFPGAWLMRRPMPM